MAYDDGMENEKEGGVKEITKKLKDFARTVDKLSWRTRQSRQFEGHMPVDIVNQQAEDKKSPTPQLPKLPR